MGAHRLTWIFLALGLATAARGQEGFCATQGGTHLPRLDREQCRLSLGRWTPDPSTAEGRVRVCVSGAGTRFEGMLERDCSRQGWEMRTFERAQLLQLPGPDEVASARKRCADGELRAVCAEDVRDAAAHNPPQPVQAKPRAPEDAQLAADERKMRARCEAKWPGDFRMQRYCLDQQQEGRREVRRWLAQNEAGASNDLKAAVLRCHIKWLDDQGYDWRMVDYCMDQQIDAYQSMR